MAVPFPGWFATMACEYELGTQLLDSGFLLIPSVRNTWSPRGRTPIVRHLARHDRLSVISGISVSPQRRRLGLYLQIHENNMRHHEVCTFLRSLLQHLRGHIIVVWDRGSIHQGEPIWHLLWRYHARLHLEHLPPYAPELNPDEGVWKLAKEVLANGRPDDLRTLRRDVVRSLKRFQGSQRHLRGCIQQSGLPSFLA